VTQHTTETFCSDSQLPIEAFLGHHLVLSLSVTLSCIHQIVFARMIF